jgi:glycosyltransferase involved in cell wall biosynthesis
LRWLYRNCEALIAASYEDYGLSPLEAASFGKPTVAFEAGGFLDTVIDSLNGKFFAEPEAQQIAEAAVAARHSHWDSTAIMRHASTFSRERFISRLQAVVSEHSG